ncbi:hypothetical protein LXA43DRAFT_427894 [Ganoderma leucocontextum]|nr:hypothetical protein LXA43DRAFT_427894 [Ganoderma leucocontextum]
MCDRKLSWRCLDGTRPLHISSSDLGDSLRHSAHSCVYRSAGLSIPNPRYLQPCSHIKPMRLEPNALGTAPVLKRATFNTGCVRQRWIPESYHGALSMFKPQCQSVKRGDLRPQALTACPAVSAISCPACADLIPSLNVARLSSVSWLLYTANMGPREWGRTPNALIGARHTIGPFPPVSIHSRNIPGFSRPVEQRGTIDTHAGVDMRNPGEAANSGV